MLVEKGAHIKIVAVVVNLSVSCLQEACALHPDRLAFQKFWVLGCHRPSQEDISAICHGAMKVKGTTLQFRKRFRKVR